jgi:pyridinium-3,5-biscarboxylic acid mononucleotide synthase
LDTDTLRQLLESYQAGSLNTDQMLERLKTLPYESLDGMANLDHHRALRTGAAEVIFGQGKTPDQVARIFCHLSENSKVVMATRVSAEMYAQIQDRLPVAVYNPVARILHTPLDPDRTQREGIVVLSAGTADMPVAEEAALTAELYGNRVERAFDVGVSGLHRLLDRLPLIQKAHVIIVVAGMEGALASVVGGLASAPIIAVPTSIGYGASFQGLAALLSMLNSCSTGVAVVNIDNGFGAGTLAARINSLAKTE